MKTGFGGNTVMGVADNVIEGVKGKNIRHYFLVAGWRGSLHHEQARILFCNWKTFM